MAKILSINGKTFENAIEEVSTDIKRKLVTDAVLIWETKDTVGGAAGVIKHYWFGHESCIKSLGLCEYMKSKVIDYINED